MMTNLFYSVWSRGFGSPTVWFVPGFQLYCILY